MLNLKLSLNQTLLTFLLYVKKNLMTQLILAISFVRAYLPLIQKHSMNHTHGPAVYVIEELPFAQELTSFT